MLLEVCGVCESVMSCEREGSGSVGELRQPSVTRSSVGFCSLWARAAKAKRGAAETRRRHRDKEQATVSATSKTEPHTRSGEQRERRKTARSSATGAFSTQVECQ